MVATTATGSQGLRYPRGWSGPEAPDTATRSAATWMHTRPGTGGLGTGRRRLPATASHANVTAGSANQDGAPSQGAADPASPEAASAPAASSSSADRGLRPATSLRQGPRRRARSTSATAATQIDVARSAGAKRWETNA